MSENTNTSRGIDTRRAEHVLIAVAVACAILLVVGVLAFVLVSGVGGCSRGVVSPTADQAGAPMVDPAGDGAGAGAAGDAGVSGAAGAGVSGANVASTSDGASSLAGSFAASQPSGVSAAAGSVPILREPTYSVVSLSAVGDNLMHMPVVNEADANAGTMGDGWYDFTPMYAGVADILATHDLNFIDQETILGGDYLGFSGYPTFNSPSAIAGQVAASGWNLVTTATNHAWDVGLEGVLNSCATWGEQTSVVETGTFSDWDDRSRIRTIERNGITFAFLAYTDYLNGFMLPDDLSYAVAWAYPDAMASDVARAHELADVVIVAMSWGDENDTTPNESQLANAQLLANLGVDLVIGFGPHVMQPIEWIQGYGDDGAPLPKQMLCVFSLGNFLSNQPMAIENVEGCFQCTFERLGDTGPVTMGNFVWTPLVNHVGGGWHGVYKLKDYPYEYAAIHESLATTGDPIGYARSLTEEIVGPSGIYIDY